MSRGHDIVKKFLKDRGAWDNNPFKPATTSTTTKTGGAPATGHAFQEQTKFFSIRLDKDEKKLNPAGHFDPDIHKHIGTAITLKKVGARNQMAKLAKERANINKAKNAVHEQNRTSLGGIESDEKFHNQIHTRNQQRRRQYDTQYPGEKGYNPGGDAPAGAFIKTKIKGLKMAEDIGYPIGAQATFANTPNQQDSSGQQPAPGLAIGDQVTCNKTGRWGSVVAQHADGTYTVQYAVRETGKPAGQETGPASWWTRHSRQNAGLGLDNTKNLGTEPITHQGVRENIAYRSMNRQENDLLLAEATDRSNYSWPHSAAVNPHANLKVGHKVRSYDFPGLTDQHYIEGHVTNMGLHGADIRVNKVVRDGKEVLPIPHHMQQVTAPLGKNNMFGHYGVHKITNQVDVVNPRPKATLKTVGGRASGGKNLK